MHEKGICAFEEPKMPETAEYRVRGLSRGLYGTLQEILRILSFRAQLACSLGKGAGRWGGDLE